MAEREHVEQADAEAGGARTEVVASTLEALQARVERGDREALRGALSYERRADEPARDRDGQ